MFSFGVCTVGSKLVVECGDGTPFESSPVKGFVQFAVVQLDCVAMYSFVLCSSELVTSKLNS